jgi:anti-anti-sigma regulatory factor
VVLDCSAVEVLDSADLSEVNRIGRTLRVMGCQPVICGLSPTVAYTAVMTDTLLDGFEFVGSLEQIDGWSR